MQCNDVRQLLLDLDWTADQRRRGAAALAHLEQCAQCKQAMADYERLSETLKPQSAVPDPAGGWQQFEERLLGAGDVAAAGRARWLPQVARLAAAFLLGVIAIEAYRAVLPTKQPADMPHTVVAGAVPTGPTVPVTPAAPFTAEEVAHNAKAFDQVSQAFDRRASWVMFAKETSDVGLSEQPMPQGQKSLLLLRLTMSRGGEAVSSSDLIIVSGQTASLSVPLTHGQSLRYEIGTTAGKPPRLNIWAELRTPSGGGETIGALATQLQLQPNQKISAGEFVTNSGAYQLKIGFSEATSGGAVGAGGGAGGGGKL